jgi:hypothetical protein
VAHAHRRQEGRGRYGYGGQCGGGTSPSPPAPPAKRKRPQPVEPTSGQNGAEAERMGAIPQLNEDVSLGAETASLPATPPPPPPPTTTPPPPIDPATVKNPCTLCNVAPIFNYERSICVTCLESLVCKKCFTTATEYRLNPLRTMVHYTDTLTKMYVEELLANWISCD